MKYWFGAQHFTKLIKNKQTNITKALNLRALISVPVEFGTLLFVKYLEL